VATEWLTCTKALAFAGFEIDIRQFESFVPTGLGITANMIDCYAALIRLWQLGDRIFPFGFSRGAYTVHCLAGVIVFCGIPTRLMNGQARRLAVVSNFSCSREIDVYFRNLSCYRDDAPLVA
jgi:uncharacterized protein (DUF2235 family)